MANTMGSDRGMTNKIVVSDAVDLLREMDADSVPLIVADPPYGIGYHSNHYKGRNPHAPVTGDWNFQIGAFLQESSRVLRVGGALYLFSRWDVYPLWLPAIAVAGLTLKTKIVWMKNNWSAGDLAGCFGNQYEEILFIVKGRHLLRGRRWPNIWEFARIPSGQMLHPTQKPVPLLRRAIASSSDKDDLIVDPFAGSGSTGIAAESEGRKYLLGDIDPRMVKLARKRLGLLSSDAIEPEQVQRQYSLEMPKPGDWGIHPEELRFIYDELKGNIINSVSLHMPEQPKLWAAIEEG